MEKPQASILRERYDPNSKWHGLFGRTACRRWDQERKQAELERTHEAHLQRQAGFEGKQLTTRFVLTAFELAGLDVHSSFDRDHAWTAIPEVLERESLAPLQRRRTADGLQVVTANLAPVAAILPDPKVAAHAQNMMHNIYTVVGDVRLACSSRRRRSWRYRVRGLKLWAVLPSQPPEAVSDANRHGTTPRLLPARLHCQTCKVSQNAIVRTNASGCAFSVEAARGRPLNIDLGQSCRISALSTQGRHPATRSYPYVTKDVREGWQLEGQPNWDPNERYGGPQWTVLLTEQDRAGQQNPYLTPQWVAKYELFWRADCGREWHSLGSCVGNSDATTEVAHPLEHALKGGLVCRYLRLVPLECEGGGALRVGVYGEPIADQSPSHRSRRGGGLGRTSRLRPSADDELPEGISYTLTLPSESFNRKFCLDGSGQKGCRCSYCLGDNGLSRSGRRLRLRLEARAEADDRHAVRSVLCQES